MLIVGALEGFKAGVRMSTISRLVAFIYLLLLPCESNL